MRCSSGTRGRWPIRKCGGSFGALLTSQMETAAAKNAALSAAGARVPKSFNDFKTCIGDVYSELVSSGAIVPKPDFAPPPIPVDYAWAAKLGLVRKPANIICSVSDDRGEEVAYGGEPLSSIIERGGSIGGSVCRLWFRRQLPPWCERFVELALTVCADHGPCVR